jgi:hypothetical protein
VLQADDVIGRRSVARLGLAAAPFVAVVGLSVMLADGLPVRALCELALHHDFSRLHGQVREMMPMRGQ